MSNRRKANGNARRKAVAWLKAQRRGCWICEAFGRDPTIDYSLDWRDPMAFVCDELVPVSRGGSPTDHGNIAAAHRRCNQWRSDKSVAEVMAIANGTRERTGCAESRKWL